MREVTHEADGPYIVTPEDIDEEKGDVAVCLCGLSADRPFCDGSHRATEDEDPDTRYTYEDDRPGERRVVEGFEFADEGAGANHEDPEDRT
ncbi:(Fe-S) protein [Halobacteriales archaeon QS_5_70_15]|nr:MAG: (Fe-S) protein [Halobacteriales archaeon QS_5_70_15]